MDDIVTIPKPTNSRKILIADDEEQIVSTLEELSKRLGLEVGSAYDGNMALQEYQNTKPDIVILDICMPGMNGLAVLAKIRAIDPECPVILISGYQHYKHIMDNRKIMPDGFIMKPFRIKTIAQQILGLLDRKEKGLIQKQRERWN
jgi:YesN/AraC family two-component response regulator